MRDEEEAMTSAPVGPATSGLEPGAETIHVGTGTAPGERRASPEMLAAEAMVEEASRESFPASDAPAWTPVARMGLPARRQACGAVPGSNLEGVVQNEHANHGTTGG